VHAQELGHLITYALCVKLDRSISKNLALCARPNPCLANCFASERQSSSAFATPELGVALSNRHEQQNWELKLHGASVQELYPELNGGGEQKSEGVVTSAGS
jgi:hypothetical protein